MVKINVVMVRFVLTALVSNVFINVRAKYCSMGLTNKHWHTFLPIANYPQFILYQYQKLGQKSPHSSTPNIYVHLTFS